MAAAMFVAIPSASGVVLVGSGMSGGGVSTIDAGSGKAVPFTTGAGAYSLTSVDMRLTYSGTVAPAMVIGIYSSVVTGGVVRIDSQLVSFAGPTVTTGTSSYNVTPASAFTLQPNTTYYFLMSVTNDVDPANIPGAIGWNYVSRTDTSGITVAGGYSIPDVDGNTAGSQFGGIYRNTGDGASPTAWTGVSGAAYNNFVLNGTLVPEPSAAVIAALGLAGTSLRRRRA